MTTLVLRDEALQQLLQMAVNAGRSRQSDETGFVHIGDTIPIVENVLFALALLRCKTADSIIEGRQLLEKILHFQTSSGNFPIYLHQFPQCHQSYLSAELFAPFHWILHDFGSVLGTAKPPLESALQKLRAYTSVMQESHAAKPAQAVKIAALAGTVDTKDFPLNIPHYLGDFLIASQLTGKPLNESPIWDYLEQTWNSEACCYAGPGLHERQDGFEPELTVYDLFMAYLTDHLSTRCKKDHPVHLYGALIRHEKCRLQKQNVSEISISPETVSDHEKRWHYRFKQTWGSSERVHSLVCQGGNCTDWSYQNGRFKFELGQIIEDDGREDQREVAFFLDRQPAKILVNGELSITFRIGDEVRLVLEDRTLVFRFTLESGEGDFMGHIMLGNRPAQIALKGENRYEAYDWQIYLRTMRRSQQCCVAVSLDTCS